MSRSESNAERNELEGGEIPVPEPLEGDEIEVASLFDSSVMRARTYRNFRRYGETYILAADSYDRPRFSEPFIDTLNLMLLSLVEEERSGDHSPGADDGEPAPDATGT